MSDYLYLKKTNSRNYQSPYLNLPRHKTTQKPSDIKNRIENLKKKFTKPQKSYNKPILKSYLPRHSLLEEKKKKSYGFKEFKLEKKKSEQILNKLVEDDESSNKTFENKYVNKKNEKRKVKHIRNFSNVNLKNFYLSNNINKLEIRKKNEKTESKEPKRIQGRYSFRTNLTSKNFKKEEDLKKNLVNSYSKGNLLKKYSQNEILLKNEKVLEKENNMLKRELIFKNNENSKSKIEVTISKNNIKELKQKNEILNKKTFDLETKIENLNFDKKNLMKINEELEFRNNDLLKKYYKDLKKKTFIPKNENFYYEDKNSLKEQIFDLLRKEIKNEKIRENFKILFSNFEKGNFNLQEENKNHLNEMKLKIDSLYDIINKSFPFNNSLSIKNLDQDVKLIKENLEIILSNNNYSENKNSEIKINKELHKIINFLEIDNYKNIEDDKKENENLNLLKKIIKKLKDDNNKENIKTKENNNLTLKTEQYSVKNEESKISEELEMSERSIIKKSKNIKELEEEIEIFKEQIIDYDNYLDKYKETIEIKNKEIKKYRTEIEEKNSKLNDIEINNEDIYIMNNKIEELNNNEINLKNSNNLIKKKLEEKDKVLDEKLKIIIQLTSDLNKKKKDLEKLEKNNNNLKEKMKFLKIQREEFINNLKNTEELEIKIKKLEKEKKELNLKLKQNELSSNILLKEKRNKNNNQSEEYEELEDLHITQSVIMENNNEIKDEENYKSNSVNFDILNIEDKNDSLYDKSKIKEYIGEEIEVFIQKILKTHDDEKKDFENKILLLEQEKFKLKKEIQDININQQKIIITNLQWDKLKKDSKTLKLIIKEKNEEIENLNLKIKMLENKIDINKEEYHDEDDYSDEEQENYGSDNNFRNEDEYEDNNNKEDEKNLEFETKLNNLKKLIENTEFQNDEKRNKIVMELEKYDILNCQMKEKISNYENKIEIIKNELISQENCIEDFKEKKINYRNEKKKLKNDIQKDKMECESIMEKKKKLEIQIQKKISLGEQISENESVKQELRNYEKNILKLEGEIKIKKNPIREADEEIIKINSILNKFSEEKNINENNLNIIEEKKLKLDKVYKVQINHLNSLEENLQKQIQILKE